MLSWYSRYSVVLLVILLASNEPDSASALTVGAIVNVSNTDSSSVASDLAIGQNGEAYVVWQESDSGTDVQFAVSLDPEGGFSESVGLTEEFVLRTGPKIATSDDTIFIVWSENDEIFFVSGAVDDTGAAEFDVPINLSNNSGHSRNPEIAASGNSVYVTWEDDTDLPSTDIFYTHSADRGQAFAEAVNLSGNEGQSIDHQIGISSNNVFVVWQDDDPSTEEGTAVHVRTSTDGGSSFGDVAIVNIDEGFASSPSIIARGSDEAYLIWGDSTGNEDVHFVKGTVDPVDNILIFDQIINVSANTGSSSSAQFTISDGGVIYVAWIDDTAGANDVFVTNSTDAGVTFSSPVEITSDASVTPGSLNLAILPSSQDLYLVWRDTNFGNGDIFLGEVRNSGHDISTPINLSANDGNSQRPSLGVFAERIYASWHDNSLGNNEILFMTVSASPTDAASISIQDPPVDSQKWGRPIEILGTTNADEEDTVTIDWGDGSTSNGIPITDSSWGPVEHTYDSTEVGPASIVATLMSPSGDLKATSSPVEIMVDKHETVLTIDDISKAVIQGSNLTVSGTLRDVDDNVGVEGVPIRFGGTGSAGLEDAITTSDGAYSAVGPSPNSAFTLWTVLAVFEGTLAYEASSSLDNTFDTVPTEATAFAVSPGSPSVVLLEGFNASLIFDKILSEETVFASRCESPENPRYLPIGLCMTISKTGELPEGSFTHVTVSYAGTILPDGHTQDEIDIFQETLAGYVDITESRDTQEQTLTGRASGFGKFVIAVAIHEEQPTGTLRQQVFVGQNDLVFNELVPRAITFDSSEYSVGSTVNLEVSDDSVNNASAVDTIDVNVTSDSDSAGIAITLAETGMNTGKFVASFTLTQDTSSTSRRELHVNPGDLISAKYSSAARGPVRIILDNVVESGMIEVQTTTVNKNHVPDFDPISDSYNLKLIDSQIANNSEVTIIMSYANVDLSDDEIISVNLFRVLQFDPASPPSGSFEWFDITYDTNAIDPVAKTVRGTTTFLSNFTIGHDVRVSDPGRGGGGLPRPGTGILLDAVATIAENSSESDHRAGGGGGRSRSTAVTQAPSGADVETSITTNSGTVVVRFETVQDGSGQLKINSNELSSYEELFDEVAILSQDNDKHGMVRVNGATYGTAGDLFDIDATSVKYDGTVDVTIPYNENTVTQFGFESSVRFLHYNADRLVWEDMTASIDEQANTVTGTLDSLSPVVAAIVIDGGERGQENKMSWIKITVSSISVLGHDQATLSTTLENTRSTGEDYILLIQVVDQNNIAQDISWQKGSLEPNQHSDVSIGWSGMESGNYRVQVLLLTDLENPELLSEAIYKDLTI